MSRRTPLSLLRSAGTLVRGLAALLLVLVAVGGFRLASAGSSNGHANNGKPAIALQSAPASQTVTRGQSVSYRVTVSSRNAFRGTVALTVSRLPAGAAAVFSPASVTLGSGGSAASTLKVTTSSSTTLGAANLTVTGTSGRLTGSLTLGLRVNPAAGSVALNATPASVTMAPGAIAVYTLNLTRTNYSGAVTFAATGLPSRAAAAFSPNPTSGKSVSLQIATAGSMRSGTYSVKVTASGSGIPTASTTVQFVLRTTGKPFTIAGSVVGLSPGVSVPLNLALTNHTKKRISISNLTVTITSVTRTSAAVASGRPCGTADYSVVQYSGRYPLTLGGLTTATLSGLGVAPAAQPKIRMINTPSNQDGCKGATLALRYTGSGQRG